MVIGSSGRSIPFISCTRALPMEVTRSVAWTALPSMSGSTGMVVTWPSHVPARVLSLSKDCLASDWFAPERFPPERFASGCFMSDWANVKVESAATTAANSNLRKGLIFILLDSLNFDDSRYDHSINRYTDIVNYNTM